MLACINPWVKNNASTLRMKTLRPIKLPDKIGCVAVPSVRINPAKLTRAAADTKRNGTDVQPKFCPKEGMHNSRLKKSRIKTAPDTSKFCSGVFVES